MKRALLKLGPECNQNCIFCHEARKTQKTTTKEIISIINNLKKAQIICLSGGEPTIRKDLFVILEHIKNKNKSSEIITNGIMLSNKQFIDKIKKFSPYLHISFHSHLKEIHKQITKTDSFDKIVQGLKNLKQNKLQYELNIVLTKFNQNRLNELMEFLITEKIEPKIIRFNLVENKGFATQSFDIIKPNMLLCAKEILKIKEKYQTIQIYANSFPECVIKKRVINSKEIVEYISYYYRKGEIVKTEEISDNEKIKINKCKNCKDTQHCEGILKGYEKEIMN